MATEIKVSESDIIVRQKEGFVIVGLKTKLPLNEATNVSVNAARVLNEITAQTEVGYEPFKDYGIVTIMVYFRNQTPTLKEIGGMAALTCAVVEVCLNMSAQLIRIHNLNDDIEEMNRRLTRRSRKHESNNESAELSQEAYA